jgi:hypothetical protein
MKGSMAKARTTKARNPVEKAAPRPRGRQSSYCEYIAEEILRRLADGEALLTICEAEDMPAESTVRWWVVNDNNGFAARYALARDVGLDHRAERLPKMASAAVGQDSAGVQAVKLLVDTEKWIIAKLAPKRYGDKLDVNLDAKIDMAASETGELLKEAMKILGDLGVTLVQAPAAASAEAGSDHEQDD